MLDRAGYVRVNYNLTDDWSVMWAHDYPFTEIKPVLMKMKKHQKVNKLPGSGYVTNKVNLATSNLPNIPKAFKIPEEVSVLKAASRLNPEKMYVQKNKNHRGIKIEKIENLDLKSQGSFVQEFVDDPFLIDGYKVPEIHVIYLQCQFWQMFQLSNSRQIQEIRHPGCGCHDQA